MCKCNPIIRSLWCRDCMPNETRVTEPPRAEIVADADGCKRFIPPQPKTKEDMS